MTFQEILPHLLEGKKLRRSSYHNDEFIQLNNKNIIVFSDGFIKDFSKGDFIENDWELCKETFNFQKALEIMKNGGRTMLKNMIYKYKDGEILYFDGDIASLHLSEFNSNDWTEVEHKND